MTNTLLINICLFSTVLLSGFYAGTGFFMAMGGNPAIKRMSDATFAEFWQHTDHFMAARMKIFGPLLIASQLLAVIILKKEHAISPFCCMLAACCILVGDLIFTLRTNHPLNKLVQSWNTFHLPPNVQEIKWRIVIAFKVRVVFMIASFTLALLATWLRSATQ